MGVFLCHFIILSLKYNGYTMTEAMWLAIISTIGVIISDIIRRVLIKLLKEKE